MVLIEESSKVHKASETDILTESISYMKGEQGFLLVMTGEPEVFVGDKSCKAKPGDLFYFGVNDEHGFYTEKECKVNMFSGRFKGQFRL